MQLRFLVAALMMVSVQSKATVLIDSVKHLSNSVSKYSKFEVKVASDELKPAKFYNPYDSSSVDMYAIFTAPSGKKYRRNAFWMVQYNRCDTCGNNVVLQVGQAGYCSPGWKDTTEYLGANDLRAYLKTQNTAYNWRVRFAPNETGTWSYKVYANTWNDQDSSASYTFSVTSSTDKGYIFKDTNHRYFRYKESGDVFIPLGLNCVKARAHHLDSLYNRVPMSYVTELISKIAPFGGNLIRIMMSPENFGIEWGQIANADGPFVYSSRQKQAKDLDSVLSLAEQSNAYLQLVLNTQDELGQDEWWTHNPYNGIISDRDNFFTDATCRAGYRQRMRYIIARWGYSPHIFAFEPMQEIDGYDVMETSDGVNYWTQTSQVVSWYRDMIRYGKFLDSNYMYAASTRYGHVGTHATPNALFDIPELDIINNHFYGVDYNINYQLNYVEQWERIKHGKKAHYFGEVGVKWGNTSYIGSASYKDGSAANNYSSTDPLYLNMSEWHNMLWATMMSGSSAPGVRWDNDIPGITRDAVGSNGCYGGRYRYLQPLSLFLQNEPIFLQKPKPIANPCSGRGVKDEMWYPSFINPFDTMNNPCNCYPKKYIYDNDVLIDNTYVASGISTTRDTSISVFGLKTDTRVIGWIHNKRNYWYNLPHSGGGKDSLGNVHLAYLMDNTRDTANIPILNNDSVTIYNLASGPYKLDFYSTFHQYDVNPGVAGAENGGVIPAFADTIDVNCNGQIGFRIPTLRTLINAAGAPFAPDYGFKLTWISPITNTNITVNTTWNVSSNIPGNVTVSNGATLTISGSNTVIKMPKKGRITVMPGAKLVVDSATITTECDSMWHGIVAHGSPTDTQSAQKQPTIEIKGNATIANAMVAIQAGDSTTFRTGGIIKATKSTFLNNRRSIEFNPYFNGKPYGNNLSFINECTFVVDSNYYGDNINKPFDCHIAMWMVHGINITGSKFYNTSTSSTRGQGIYSLEAGYKVKPGCNGYWSTNGCVGTLIKPRFVGFSCGILAESLWSGAIGTVTVDHSDFDSNSVGVRAINVEDIAVLRSTFDIGNGQGFELTDCYQNAGTYTTGVNKFRIEENQYIGHTNSNQPSGWINMGAVTESSGAYNNEIYKNSFTGLTHGAHAWKDNSSIPGQSGFTWFGLRYYCNTFTDNKIDIAVSAQNNEGIATDQSFHTSGVGIEGTGNVYTDSNYSDLLHNISNTGHALTFVYAGAKPSAQAWTTNSTVSFIQVSQERGCDSKISTGGTSLSSLERSSVSTSKSALLSAIPSIKQSLADSIDEGDTDGLIAGLAGKTALAVHETLINVSPFVSETALRYVIDNNLMNQALSTEVLQFNPDVLRTPGFLSYLEEAGFDLDDFQEALTQATARTQHQSSIVASEHRLSETYRLLITDMKNDFAHEYLSELPGLHSERSTLDATYELINFYYSIDSATSAIALFSGIPTNYTLSAELEDVYLAQDSLFSIIGQIIVNNQSTLTTLQSQTLSDIAENFSGKKVGNTANILLDVMQHRIRSLCITPTAGEKQSAEAVRKKKPVKEISVFPNPAKGHVVFWLHLPEADEHLRLSIVDVHGKLVFETGIERNIGLFHWYTRDLPNGMYFYRFYDGKKTLENGKVVISK